MSHHLLSKFFQLYVAVADAFIQIKPQSLSIQELAVSYGSALSRGQKSHSM
jgi:hypothetical protein